MFALSKKAGKTIRGRKSEVIFYLLTMKYSNANGLLCDLVQIEFILTFT